MVNELRSSCPGMRQSRVDKLMSVSPKAVKVPNRGWPNEVREPTANRKQTMRPWRERTYFVLAIFFDVRPLRGRFFSFHCPQAHSLWLLRQRLWTFAAFGDGKILFFIFALSYLIILWKWIFMQIREPKCINIQYYVFTFLYTTFVNNITVCKQTRYICLQFSKLILLICKTLGFMNRKCI